MPDVQIVAVAGRNAEKVKAFAERMQIPYWTTDWQTLVSDPKIDIVCVLTPPYARKEMAVAAAQSGKHLFLEKPIALSLEEADEIIAAVERNGVRAVVNHIMRYHPLYSWLKERIDQKNLGSVRKVWLVNFASSEGLGHEHWFWDERKSGGVLVEHGVHFYHLFSWLLDDKPEPIATLGHEPFEAWSIVRFPSHDALGEFYHCFDKPASLERNFGGIAFERGYATFEGWLPLKIRIEQNQSTEVVAEERVMPYSKTELYRWLIQQAFCDLLKAIRNPNHQVSSDLHSARDALSVALHAKEVRMDFVELSETKFASRYVSATQ
ncbi:MAG: Gfo/Idh/MocA family protein [Armatimonadota bacterium]